MKINYNNVMESIIEKEQINHKIPTLLLHVCCAPCSSAVLERLMKYFKITIYYYNPNISPYGEYTKRISELKRLINEIDKTKEITILEGKYEPEKFEQFAPPLAHEKEGGTRCTKCYYLRLNQTAMIAAQQKFDYFTTTLSISPYKDAEKLNLIGKQLEKQYGICYLYSDFKKKEGYKRSIELSKVYHLYRQDYCGCIYSKEERENEKATL